MSEVHSINESSIRTDPRMPVTTSVINLIALNIIQWGVDRNIVGGATPQRQFLKLMSEFGELGDAIAKNDIEGIKDGIGDSFVVLMLIGAMLGLKPLIIDALPTWISFTKFSPIIGEEEPTIESSYARTADKMTYLGLVVCMDSNSEGSHPVLNCVGHLSRIAASYELTMETCALHAYNEIKDRTGVLFNGTFIKSTDARYADALAQIALQRASTHV